MESKKENIKKKLNTCKFAEHTTLIITKYEKNMGNIKEKLTENPIP